MLYDEEGISLYCVTIGGSFHGIEVWIPGPLLNKQVVYVSSAKRTPVDVSRGIRNGEVMCIHLPFNVLAMLQFNNMTVYDFLADFGKSLYDLIQVNPEPYRSVMAYDPYKH